MVVFVRGRFDESFSRAELRKGHFDFVVLLQLLDEFVVFLAGLVSQLRRAVIDGAGEFLTWVITSPL